MPSLSVSLNHRFSCPSRASARVRDHWVAWMPATETFVYLKLRKQTYAWGVQ